MNNESYSAALARKLRLKQGQSALALEAPDEYIAALEAALGREAVATVQASGSSAAVFDVVSLFARSRAVVTASAPGAITATRDGGALWIMWPKKTSMKATDLDRDTLWALLRPLGWGPVASIAIDETWSALRFRPEAEIQRRSSL